MQKEFVEYELALRLKELGFNEPCFGMYCEDRFHLLYPNSYKDIPDNVYREVDAPLYQQAFRWFREKGFLIDFTSHDKDTHDFYIKWSEGKSILSDTYNTYEEAELECLKKLIEIVESKKE